MGLERCNRSGALVAPMLQLPSLCNSSSRGSSALCYLRRHCLTYAQTHTCRQTPIHIKWKYFIFYDFLLLNKSKIKVRVNCLCLHFLMRTAKEACQSVTCCVHASICKTLCVLRKDCSIRKGWDKTGERITRTKVCWPGFCQGSGIPEAGHWRIPQRRGGLSLSLWRSKDEGSTRW